ncbi:P-loop containing nucleoside triphosphate hydrolase protein [Cyathus striatus]|nr:P-loop containing nucleoside triphosphate hydrolase protein [Cyathus striatus]
MPQVLVPGAADVAPASSDGVGLSNPQLSQGRRRMLDLVNKLHSTGVQVDIDLPQIAVIGSQSAGKSSLIESISGITLPRAAGTCTRCPTECRLSRSEDRWKCVVSLRFTTDARGQVLGQARNEPFGPTIYDKKEVEDRIRRAQRAILNPSAPAKHYLESEDVEGEASQLSFSTNCVSLQISGPDVADLSFCDLPGLIASVSRGGSTSDIALVENLVTSYIKKPSCIILLTVTCETDFENQGAFNLARLHDPEGKRTIGVLTKPDRIPQGEEQSWLAYIRNEREPLLNNWYCVKQPSSSELKTGMSWEEARSSENRFFSMTPPWSELDSVYQKYLRTFNLLERLSSILSDLISKRLPGIQDELQKMILKTTQDIILLPREPSKDPLSEVATLLYSFAADLRQHVDGVPDDDGLLQAIQPFQEHFRRQIRATAPAFVPFEKEKAFRASLDIPSFLSTEDGKIDDIGAHAIYIDEVLERAKKARTRELPGHYPFIVQRKYIEEFLKNWEAPTILLCNRIHGTLVDYIRELVTERFADFGQGNLENRIHLILHGHLKKCLQRTQEKIKWLLEVEGNPFSLNTHYLQDYKDKFLAHYKDARKDKHPPDDSHESQGHVKSVLSGLAALGFSRVEEKDFAKLLSGDKMEPALEIMANVRSYFQVSYKRFVDNIPLAIDYELIRGVERGALKELYSGLGLNGVDAARICQELVQESPQVAHRREELSKKLQRLNVASEQLLRIGL